MSGEGRATGAGNDAERIVIVDDHAIVRHGLSRLIAGETDLVVSGEAETTEEALDLLERGDADLVVVDLALGGSDGLDLIRRIAGQYPEVRILVLSIYDESVYAERCLRAGASGYVMKEAAPRTVLQAIRTVLRGEIYVSEQMMERVLHRISGRRRDAHASPLEALTDRELQVLRLLGEGRTTREVADTLHRSVKTVETHRANIMKKLDLENATQLLHRAIVWVERERSGGTEGDSTPS